MDLLSPGEDNMRYATHNAIVEILPPNNKWEYIA